jgi:Protein of unknown function (DUF4231)
MSKVSGRDKARQAFLREWGIPDPGGEFGPAEDEAFTIAATEWARCHTAAQRAKYRFITAQVVAPVAAGIATVLATTSVSRWAVIPAASATIASSLLASFGFREAWRRLSHVGRQLGFEIVEFATGSGPYRDLDGLVRVDRLMGRIEELSILAPPSAAPPPQ